MAGHKLGRAIAVVVVVATMLAVTGCSDSHDLEPDPTRSPSPQVAASPPPAVSLSPSPTASAQPSPAAPAARLYVYDPDEWTGSYTPELSSLDTANADGSVGSGCTPPSADSLPDGIWIGVVGASGSDWIDFDLACSYNIHSDTFRAEVEKRGEDAAPIHQLIRNTNPATRRIYFAADAVGHTANFLENDSPTVPWAEVVDALTDSDHAWLWVNGGHITEIQLAYEP